MGISAGVSVDMSVGVCELSVSGLRVGGPS